MKSGEDTAPQEAPTAPIRIRLPDGQHILGLLHHRFQGDNGAWFYQVSVSLWSAVHDPAGTGDRAEPYDVSFAAPASHVQPVDGTDYTRIPIRRSRAALVRARAGHGPAPAAAAPSWPPAVRGDDTDRWYIQTHRAAAGTPPPASTMHHAECFVGSAKELLTTAQALQVLAQPGITVCKVCDAGRLQRG